MNGEGFLNGTSLICIPRLHFESVTYEINRVLRGDTQDVVEFCRRFRTKEVCFSYDSQATSGEL